MISLSGVKIVEENQTLLTHIRSVAFFATSSPVGVAIGNYSCYGNMLTVVMATCSYADMLLC